jgi:hypothetical protein
MHGLAPGSTGPRRPGTVRPTGRVRVWNLGSSGGVFTAGSVDSRMETLVTHSLIGADRGTNMKVVGVALAAVTVLGAALTAVRVNDPASSFLTANGPTVVKPEKAIVFTHGEPRGAAR